MTLSKSQARVLANKVLAQASFGDVRVRIDASSSGNSRFADTQPTTAGDVETLSVSVTAAKDRRHATATGNRTDAASLARLVKQAETLAQLAPVDPEHMPALGRTKYLRVNAMDRGVAGMSDAARADIVGPAVKAGKGEGLDVSGFLQHGRNTVAVADRAGLFGYHESTSVEMSCTCRTPDGTGSARSGFVSHGLAGLDGGALALDAAKWAWRSKAPTATDPGKYTVLLSPAAVAELMSFLVRSLSHRRASEGRSYFSVPGGGTKIGESLFDSRVRLWSDPSDKANPATPIAYDGRPYTQTLWVAGGRLLALAASRYWADKAGVDARPTPSSLHMAGGTGDMDSLLAGIKRGVLVSRFWYNRMLEPQTILATGLTRDGTFLIENGRITRPLKNMRYNDSPLTLLKKLVALGKPQRAPLRGRRVYVVPPMVVEGFNFESVSDAV